VTYSKNHRLVRFVMYYFITVLSEMLLALCSDVCMYTVSQKKTSLTF